MVAYLSTLIRANISQGYFFPYQRASPCSASSLRPLQVREQTWVHSSAPLNPWTSHQTSSCDEGEQSSRCLRHEKHKNCEGRLQHKSKNISVTFQASQSGFVSLKQKHLHPLLLCVRRSTSAVAGSPGSKSKVFVTEQCWLCFFSRLSGQTPGLRSSPPTSQQTVGAAVLRQEGGGRQQGLEVVGGLVALESVDHQVEVDLAQRLLHLRQEALCLAFTALLGNILWLWPFLHGKMKTNTFCIIVIIFFLLPLISPPLQWSSVNCIWPLHLQMFQWFYKYNGTIFKGSKDWLTGDDVWTLYWSCWNKWMVHHSFIPSEEPSPSLWPGRFCVCTPGRRRRSSAQTEERVQTSRLPCRSKQNKSMWHEMLSYLKELWFSGMFLNNHWITSNTPVVAIGLVWRSEKVQGIWNLPVCLVVVDLFQCFL